MTHRLSDIKDVLRGKEHVWVEARRKPDDSYRIVIGGDGLAEPFEVEMTFPGLYMVDGLLGGCGFDPDPEGPTPFHDWGYNPDEDEYVRYFVRDHEMDV